MEKYKLQYSKSFVKDYKKLSNQNKDLVDEILDRLLNREILESKYKDHELKGSLKGIRDCHIKPDLVLLYKVINNELALIALRVNSHSEVFK